MSCTLFAFRGFMGAMRFFMGFLISYLRHVLFGDKVQLRLI